MEFDSEDEEEEVLDLNDPNNEILDDPDDGMAPADEDTSSGEGESAEALQTRKVPERDDAIVMFTTQKPLHTISSCPAHPDVLACGGEADIVYILRLDKQSEAASFTLRQLCALRGHSDTVTQLAFSPDGKWLASGGMDNRVCLWDAQRLAAGGDSLETVVLSDLAGEVGCLVWHPSSAVFVAGGADAQAVMWDASTATVSRSFFGHRGAVTCAAWTLDGRRLLTASQDGSLICFLPRSGNTDFSVTKDLSPKTAGISAMVVISSDIVVAGCDDGSIHLVSMQSRRTVSHLIVPHTQPIESIGYNAALELFCSTCSDGHLCVWNSSDGQLRSNLTCGAGLTSIIWIGARIAAACADGDVCVWDGRQLVPDPQIRFSGHTMMALDVCSFALHGEELIASTSDDGTVRVFSLHCVAEHPLQQTGK